MRLNERRGVTWTVAGCAALHFLVDGLCLCCLLLASEAVGVTDVLTVFVVYNVLAFLTQPMTGLMADRMRHPHWMLLSALMLLTLGVAATTLAVHAPVTVVHVAALSTAVLMGLGNSLFHVWGGRLVATTTHNDMRSLGVFVATGAFGLAVGAVWCSWWLTWLMLLACCLITSCEVRGTSYEKTAPRTSHLVARKEHALLLVLLVMLCVALRSAVGTGFTAGLERTDSVVLLTGIAAMAGKAAGGWLCRWTGLAVGVTLMLAGTVGACFLPTGLLRPLTGLFFVNCTMPVTLWLANAVLPGREGLAFGLLAAALIPGYLLAVM